ncbi:hypothetical protein GC093_20830 [Paenibacillus sp. LMG 31456]|uniref:PIN domain-containing protein n=1 Tax=Paenibacillus foliorum TaxID=2654974 RepID=A0A972GWA8_9BACL|nr:hypothetical protein [Paenibacillus foliorum]NOU95654.1 hypothetical protein [Paenibacillus foliorum]
MNQENVAIHPKVFEMIIANQSHELLSPEIQMMRSIEQGVYTAVTPSLTHTLLLTPFIQDQPGKAQQLTLLLNHYPNLSMISIDDEAAQFMAFYQARYAANHLDLWDTSTLAIAKISKVDKVYFPSLSNGNKNEIESFKMAEIEDYFEERKKRNNKEEV